MAFGTTSRQNIALLIFNATTWTGLAVNDTGTPITNVFPALHTADPTSGNQATNEATYTSYVRPNVARGSGGYTCSAGVVTNTATISFATCTGGSSTVTNVSLGRLVSGTGEVICAGATGASLAVTNGITPQFSASGLSVTIA